MLHAYPSAIQTVRSAFRERKASELFPVGPDSKPSTMLTTVAAVQESYKDHAETLAQQHIIEEEKDRMYGVVKVTKRAARNALIGSYFE